MDSDTEGRIARVLADLRPKTSFPRRQTAARRLSERMAKNASPGIGIAVVDGGGVVWERGFGIRETGRTEPVEADTLFQAASISKPVFALGVMRLVEKGEVALDEDVQHYLTSWRVPSNGEWTPRITLRQLLSHCAGTTIHGFPGYPASGPWPTLAQALDGSPPANHFPVVVDLIPGLQCRYSGGGTTIAQAVVTDALGLPFPEIMNDLVFKPLELRNSTFAQPLPDALARRAATAHPWNGTPLPGGWHVYPEMAAAGLWTTAGDLARIGVDYLRALRGEDASLGLSAESAAEMLRPQLPGGTEGDDYFGLGWECSGKDGAFRFHHEGWNEGFVAGLWLYPESGKGAAIMINSNQGSALLFEIQEAIGREYEWPKPQKETIVRPSPAPIEGRYRTQNGHLCELARDGEQFTLRIDGQPPLPFVREGSGFVSDCVNATLDVRTSEDGGAALVLTQSGRKFRFERFD